MARRGQKCVVFKTVSVKGHTKRVCGRYTRRRKPWPWGEEK